jgi:ABC-type dipeptide/oligopeptide/nickel transport system permease subunit
MKGQQEETSWGKIIAIGFIFLLVAIISIVGLVQNYYALKAIASIPKMVNEIEGDTQSLGGLNFVTTSRTCYQNGIKINCSDINPS